MATSRDSAVLDELMALTRVLVAVSAESLHAVADRADLTQMRVLVTVASTGSATLGDIAEATGLHVSTASRTCERMVRAGLLLRAADPADRRTVRFRVSDEGARVVRTVMRRRRAALRPVLASLGEPARRRLLQALREFSAAAGEPSDIHLWSMGWTTARRERTLP